jgi:hypothetical protein
MSDQLRRPIPLTDAQLAELSRITNSGKGNFAAGYALVHQWIKDNPAAQEDGTAFWFEQAQGINGNNSLSARFIRRHTENGQDAANIANDIRLPMQKLLSRPQCS